jgi:hypothetical protein
MILLTEYDFRCQHSLPEWSLWGKSFSRFRQVLFFYDDESNGRVGERQKADEYSQFQGLFVIARDKGLFLSSHQFQDLLRLHRPHSPARLSVISAGIVIVFSMVSQFARM